MPKYLNIEIPESCHENWNAMQPNNQGRHCLSCQKTVVDFTAMTDAELINFFSNKKDNVCGRFTSEQLDKDFLIPKKKIHWLKYFFQFALPAFLLSIKPSSKFFAQQHKTQATIEPIKKVNTEFVSEKISLKDSVVGISQNGSKTENPRIIIGGARTYKAGERFRIFSLSGNVVEESGQPIPYASVFVKGSTIGTACNENGAFNLNVPNSAKELVVTSVGMEQKEVAIKSINKSEPIVLRLSTELQGEVIVVKSRKKKKTTVLQQEEKVCSATIYPNPIPPSGILNINLKNAELGLYNVQISNLQGQLIQTEKIELAKKQTSISFALKAIPAGNYVVIITNTKSDKKISSQLVVQ
ncbi:MAG: carboxypeptidase-like regulatory domain-containing protein [Chitinophagaceae bacterium]|jgi:hypothetical protein|nr:carboxypeptidase-like regulatory domain-containing protein [Chitinophagaceae bacterium]